MGVVRVEGAAGEVLLAAVLAGVAVLFEDGLPEVGLLGAVAAGAPSGVGSGGAWRVVARGAHPA